MINLDFCEISVSCGIQLRRVSFTDTLDEKRWLEILSFRNDARKFCRARTKEKAESFVTLFILLHENNDAPRANLVSWKYDTRNFRICITRCIHCVLRVVCKPDICAILEMNIAVYIIYSQCFTFPRIYIWNISQVNFLLLLLQVTQIMKFYYLSTRLLIIKFKYVEFHCLRPVVPTSW